jgi:hypothetical protein
MSKKLSNYDNLSFEEATRIIYYVFCSNAKTFMAQMEELMVSPDKPSRSIAPIWYDAYASYHREKEKAGAAE